MSMLDGRHVLILGGGPDAEREVSLESSRCVFEAMKSSGRYRVTREVIGRVTPEQLRSMAGDVIFPVLHGAFGEGGGLQDLLERSGRAFVGCRAPAARLAMDKMGTKLAASRVGVPTLPSVVLNLADEGCAIAPPVVYKPVHEGSSVGVHLCRDAGESAAALGRIRADRREHPERVYMAERAVLGGRELTVGVLDGVALPVVEIRPAVEFYTYEAKYQRDDTKYEAAPTLPPGLTERLQSWAMATAKELGVRHLARVDFLLDRAGGAWLLEVNTMPGFTSHSLLPMAAAKTGLDFRALCERLCEMAIRDGASA